VINEGKTKVKETLASENRVFSISNYTLEKVDSFKYIKLKLER